MDTTFESDGSVIYLIPKLGIEYVLKCTDRLRSIFLIGSHKNRNIYTYIYKYIYVISNVIWPCVPGVLLHNILG